MDWSQALEKTLSPQARAVAVERFNPFQGAKVEAAVEAKVEEKKRSLKDLIFGGAKRENVADEVESEKAQGKTSWTTVALLAALAVGAWAVGKWILPRFLHKPDDASAAGKVPADPQEQGKRGSMGDGAGPVDTPSQSGQAQEIPLFQRLHWGI